MWCYLVFTEFLKGKFVLILSHDIKLSTLDFNYVLLPVILKHFLIFSHSVIIIVAKSGG